MTVSVGVTQYFPGEEDTVFIKRADSAMYTAKTSGKNRVCQAK
jgi:PleD family two-component response regulator